MNPLLHPSQVLYPNEQARQVLPACEHFAGSEKLILKALDLQQTHGPLFDITCDCEDGAPAGFEREHAEMIAQLITSEKNQFNRIGLRIHDVTHPHWRRDLEIIIPVVKERLAYVTLPKPSHCQDVRMMIAALRDVEKQAGLPVHIPVHVLIETHGALREVWDIAALPSVEVLDFGLMDFVSAHRGAIPASAMKSPGQFEHPLIARAKSEVSAAALAYGLVPSHNVTTELHNPSLVFNDARRAREQFAFLRMWSIHPSQIQPILEAMRPDFTEVNAAAAILLTAQVAAWGPIQHDGKLHDRASYRFFWELLQRAKATGMNLPAEVEERFFAA